MTRLKLENEQRDVGSNDISKIFISEIGNTTNKLLQNEGAGERRVEFFIALATVIVAALAVAGIETIKVPADTASGGASEFLIDKSMLAVASIGALSILLGFGILTLFRVVKRNQVTEEYKQVSSYLRKSLGLDDPYDIVDQVIKNSRLKIAGFGLTYFIAYMNSVVLFIVFLLLVPAGVMPTNEISEQALLGALIFLASAVVQVRVSRTMRNEYKKKLKEAFKVQLLKENSDKSHSHDA